MDILCRNIPEPVKEHNIRKELAPKLADLSIYTFHCRKLYSQGHAIITIPDEKKARALLKKYGQNNNQNYNIQNNRNNNNSNRINVNNANNPNVRRQPAQAHSQLYLFRTPIYLSKSNKTPDEHLLRILVDEERERLTRPTNAPTSRAAAPKYQRSFNIVSFSCGCWDYKGNEPIFVEYFNVRQRGKVVFRKNGVFISISLPGGLEEHQIEFNHANISGPIYTGSLSVPSLTLSTDIPPKLFRVSVAMAMEEILSFSPRPSQTKKFRTRVTHIGGHHEHVAASCFTYRFVLADFHDLPRVRNISADRHIPDMVEWFDQVILPMTPYYTQITRFMVLLAHQDLAFRIKFQLQMLVWNGCLSPMKVAELIPHVHHLVRRLGRDRSVQILGRLSRTLRYAGPDVEKSAFDVQTIADQFSDTELDSVYHYRDSDKTKENPHQISIHRAMVTPVGIYIYGPTLETKNRVLRLYSDYRDYFLRVEFLDESSDPVRYDPKANLDEIFQGRFKSVLLEGIRIGGRHFEFLGFSHSSLRYQTCWFVAPFRDHNGDIINAHTMIPKLGDFTRILSPARCAARIGQTFSDTTTSIRLDHDVVGVIPDIINKNGRVFSDGVGTLSKEVMHKIWREYAHRAKVKPTVFQIRFGGKQEVLYPPRKELLYTIQAHLGTVRF